MSADTARTNDRGVRLPPRVAAALAAAEIPPSKLGSGRRARLSEAERALYFWILRRFSTDGRPGNADISGEATRLGRGCHSTRFGNPGNSSLRSTKTSTDVLSPSGTNRPS